MVSPDVVGIGSEYFVVYFRMYILLSIVYVTPEYIIIIIL